MSSLSETMIIGLTGGIASGKSTVVEMIKEAGYKVIDADQLVHDMLFYMIKIKQILTITGLLHPYLLINTANGIRQIRYLLPLQILLVKFLQIDRRCKVAVLLLKKNPCSSGSIILRHGVQLRPHLRIYLSSDLA